MLVRILPGSDSVIVIYVPGQELRTDIKMSFIHGEAGIHCIGDLRGGAVIVDGQCADQGSLGKIALPGARVDVELVFSRCKRSIRPTPPVKGVIGNVPGGEIKTGDEAMCIIITVGESGFAIFLHRGFVIAAEDVEREVLGPTAPQFDAWSMAPAGCCLVAAVTIGTS